MPLASSPPVGETLLSLLSPFGQLAIGGCALLVLVVSIRKLAQRGRSRMTTAMLVTGVAALAVAALNILIQVR
jgi:hypothetical protein